MLLVMKTEVTTQLVSLIARSFGAKVVDNLLVGFKYIGDGLRQFDETGRFAGVHADVQEFCIGVEESHGILTTPEIRDKDAAGGALLLVECARDASQSGQTLIDVLDDLRAQYGVVVNQLTSTVMQGAVGRTRIQDLMTSLRQSPPSHIGGTAVVNWTDHQDEAGLWGSFKSDTDKASRNVLVFHLEDDARIILTPFGYGAKVQGIW